MTIYKDISNTRPMNLEYMATSQDVVSVASPKAIVTTAFCVCAFECDYVEKAFGKVGGDEFEKDETSVLVKLTVPSDTVDFILVDTLTGLEYDLNTGTYGTYFPNGFQADNPLYTGVVVEWTEVLSTIGSSFFKIKIVQNSIGQEYITETHKFQVIPFSEQQADNTIRIKSEYGGYFNNGIDYTGLNWSSKIRVPATITGKDFVEEKTEYVALKGESRVYTPIQDRTETEWSVVTELLPETVYNGLIYDKLKASKVYLSDYALFAKEKLRNLKVKYNSAEQGVWVNGNTKASWNINLSETEIKLKRNFK